MAAARQSIASPLFVDEKPLSWIDVADRTPAATNVPGWRPGSSDHGTIAAYLGKRASDAPVLKGVSHYDAQDAVSRLQSGFTANFA